MAAPTPVSLPELPKAATGDAAVDALLDRLFGSFIDKGADEAALQLAGLDDPSLTDKLIARLTEVTRGVPDSEKWDNALDIRGFYVQRVAMALAGRPEPRAQEALIAALSHPARTVVGAGARVIVGFKSTSNVAKPNLDAAGGKPALEAVAGLLGGESLEAHFPAAVACLLLDRPAGTSAGTDRLAPFLSKKAMKGAVGEWRAAQILRAAKLFIGPGGGPGQGDADPRWVELATQALNGPKPVMDVAVEYLEWCPVVSTVRALGRNVGKRAFKTLLDRVDLRGRSKTHPEPEVPKQLREVAVKLRAGDAEAQERAARIEELADKLTPGAKSEDGVNVPLGRDVGMIAGSVGTDGGPVLVVDSSAELEWEGAQKPREGRLVEAKSRWGELAFATDYDRALDASDGGVAGGLRVGKVGAFVTPEQACDWMPLEEGAVLVVEGGEAGVKKALKSSKWKPLESVLDAPSGKLVLLDSANQGGKRPNRLVVAVAPGSYAISELRTGKTWAYWLTPRG